MDVAKHPRLLDDPRLQDILDCIEEGQTISEVSLRFSITKCSVRKLLRYMKLRDLPDADKALEVIKDMDLKPEEVSDTLPATRVYGGVDVLEEMIAMKNTAERLRTQAEKAEKLPQAISALREQMRIFEVMIKMADRMRRNQEFNPWNHPDVISYQEGMLSILKRHPEAMKDVIEYIDRFNSRTERPAEEGEGE